MFTGIVTDIGTVAAVKPLREGVGLRIDTVYDPGTIDIGASISCGGVCLTVTGLPEAGSNARWFEVEAWEEALRLTTASQWKALLALAEDWTRPVFPLTGEDVMALKVPHGPLVGQMLREVEEWWIDQDFPDDRDGALERLKLVVSGMAE